MGIVEAIKGARFEFKLTPYLTILIASIIISISLFLRLLWLDKPEGSLIFDEAYYVNAARLIAGIEPSKESIYYGSELYKDPNLEHPLLAKLIIASSIRLFGDNAFGWRIPSVIFGTLAIPLVYLIVIQLSNNRKLALLSSFIFSFDNLVFVHSRIATLDIFMLTFMLLGIYLYFAKKSLLTGVAMGLAILCKLPAIFGVAIIIFYELAMFFLERNTSGFNRLKKLVIAAIATVLIVAYPITPIFTRFQNPVEHFIHMYNHASALVRAGGPIGIESYPWQWLANQVEIPYLKVDGKVMADGKEIGTVSLVHFSGSMNPAVIFFALIGIGYCIHLYIKNKDKLSLLAVSWFLVTYIPYFPGSILGNRIMYIFYFLNTIPAVAIAISCFMSDEKIPKIVLISYLITLLIGFAFLFPFKKIP
jgi:predicted membrane-bound dolichyl-phosphate-mannose-protein mannosyltransferase